MADPIQLLSIKLSDNAKLGAQVNDMNAVTFFLKLPGDRSAPISHQEAQILAMMAQR